MALLVCNPHLVADATTRCLTQQNAHFDAAAPCVCAHLVAVRRGAPARGVQRVRAVAVARVRRVRRRVLRLLVRGPAGGARALPKEARALSSVTLQCILLHI